MSNTNPTKRDDKEGGDQRRCPGSENSSFSSSGAYPVTLVKNPVVRLGRYRYVYRNG